MAGYQYLVATLPSLQFNVPSPIAKDEFVARCTRHCTGSDLSVILDSFDPHNADRNSTLSSSVLEGISSWDRAYRNELVKLRARALSSDAEKWKRESAGNFDAETAARKIFGIEDPLEAEIALELLRWNHVDTLLFGHYFDLETLVAYAIHISIEERLAGFSAEKGDTEYRKAYRTILEAFSHERAPGETA